MPEVLSLDRRKVVSQKAGLASVVSSSSPNNGFISVNTSEISIRCCSISFALISPSLPAPATGVSAEDNQRFHALLRRQGCSQMILMDIDPEGCSARFVEFYVHVFRRDVYSPLFASAGPPLTGHHQTGYYHCAHKEISGAYFRGAAWPGCDRYGLSKQRATELSVVGLRPFMQRHCTPAQAFPDNTNEVQQCSRVLAIVTHGS